MCLSLDLRLADSLKLPLLEFRPFFERARKFWQGLPKIIIARGAVRRVEPDTLFDDQRVAYEIILKAHRESKQILMTVYGRAGSGKSVVIGCLRYRFQGEVRTGSITASAAFLVEGSTLHQLLGLPTDEGKRFNLS